MEGILHDIWDYMNTEEVKIHVILKDGMYWITIVDRFTEEPKYIKERCLVPSVIINPIEIEPDFYNYLDDLGVFIELSHDTDIKLTFGDLYKNSYTMTMKKISDTEWILDSDVFKENIANNFHKEPMDCMDFETVEVTDDEVVECDRWSIGREHYTEPCGVAFWGKCVICGREFEGQADDYEDEIKWEI